MSGESFRSWKLTSETYSSGRFGCPSTLCPSALSLMCQVWGSNLREIAWQRLTKVYREQPVSTEHLEAMADEPKKPRRTRAAPKSTGKARKPNVVEGEIVDEEAADQAEASESPEDIEPDASE